MLDMSTAIISVTVQDTYGLRYRYLIENCTRRIQWYHPKPSRVTNTGYESQFGETVYIFEVHGDRKVKSDAQVAINKNSDPVQKWFPWGWVGKQCP